MIYHKKSNVEIAWYLLYITYIIIPVIAGIDKYFNALADWHIYLNHSVPDCFHIFSPVFMHLVGILEIFSGLLVLYKPRIGGYIVAAWLIAISINVISMGAHTHDGHMMVHYDIALRDIGLAIGAYVLVILSKELGK